MKSKLLLVLLLASVSVSQAANYYWVGGTGNWSDYASHWATTSGGAVFHSQVPTPSDNVFFDGNSFTASGQVVIIDQTIVQCYNMSWTGVTNNPSFVILTSNKLRILGSLTFVSGMTTTITGDVSFESSTSGQTITTAGASFANVSFDGVGGSWTLLDNFTSADDYHYYITMANGTLNTNNKMVSAFAIDVTGGLMNLSGSVINVTFRWQNLSPNPATINAGTSTINLTGWPLAGVAYFTGSGQSHQTYYNLSFNSTASLLNIGQIGNDGGSTFTGTASFNGNVFVYNSGNVFNNMTLTPGYTYTFKSGVTQTINGTLNAIGNCGALINIKADINGTAAILSKSSGSVSVSYTALRDISAVGGASFSAANSFDLGNNSGWTITAPAPKNLYWVGNGGNWGDGGHWSLSSGGSASGCSPTPVDNVFFDANSFTSSGQTVTVDIPVALCHNISWTGVTNNPAFVIPTSNKLRILGSLTFVSGMTTTITGDVSYESSTSGQTITTAGASFANVSFDGVGGSWTLLDNFTSADDYHYYITMANGTLNTNNKMVSAFAIDVTGGLMNLSGSVINVTFRWQNLSPNPATINAGTSTINLTGWPLAGVAYFTGSGQSHQTYYNLSFNSTASLLNIGQIGNDGGSTFTGTASFNGNVFVYNSGNVFNNMTLTPGYTYTFKSGVTQTINGTLNAIGTPGFPVRIQSDASGVPSIFSKSSGSVCLDYARIKDITATGGAFFNGGLSPTRSFDEGGNTGWVFTGSSNIFYQDADGDGYGNSAITAQVCTLPPGYVTNNTDCNDANTAVHPDATEICGNGIDDNCNGLIDEGCCTGSVNAGADITLYYGYPPTQCATRTAIITNGTGPYTYQWTLSRPLLSGESMSGANSQTVTVCLLQNASLCVTVTETTGCNYSDCAMIYAQDIRCSTNGNNVNVNVCHNGHTICVDQNAVPAHLAHGDYLGQCTNNSKQPYITEEKIPEVDFRIYPNPSNGNFTVSINLTDENIDGGQLRITTIGGQEIKKLAVNHQTIMDIYLKDAGVYLIRLITNKQVLTKKITVLK
jgi:hypothetical protein